MNNVSNWLPLLIIVLVAIIFTFCILKASKRSDFEEELFDEADHYNDDYKFSEDAFPEKRHLN